MTTVLVALGFVVFSMIVWGVATRRWTRESRQARKELRGSAPIPFLMRVPVPWVYLLAYLIGATGNLIVPIRAEVPDTLWMARLAGLAILLPGLFLAVSALRLFHKSETTTVPFETPAAFVTSGPYRVSRNPMYVGLALIYIGVAGTQAQVWPLAMLPLVLLYVDRAVIPFEERGLTRVFGETYETYCATVPRWL